MRALCILGKGLRWLVIYVLLMAVALGGFFGLAYCIAAGQAAAWAAGVVLGLIVAFLIGLIIEEQ